MIWINAILGISHIGSIVWSFLFFFFRYFFGFESNSSSLKDWLFNLHFPFFYRVVGRYDIDWRIWIFIYLLLSQNAFRSFMEYREFLGKMKLRWSCPHTTLILRIEKYMSFFYDWRLTIKTIKFMSSVCQPFFRTSICSFFPAVAFSFLFSTINFRSSFPPMCLWLETIHSMCRCAECVTMKVSL